MGQGTERRRDQCGNGHKSVARMQSRMLHSNPGVSPPSGTAAPQQRPACSGPLGAKAAGQGVSVTVQSQEPPRRGAAGPRQGPVKPNTGTTVPPRLGSQAKKTPAKRPEQSQAPKCPHSQLQLHVSHLHTILTAPSASPRGHGIGTVAATLLPALPPAAGPHSPLGIPAPSLPSPAHQPPAEPQIPPRRVPARSQGTLFPWGCERQGPPQQL